MVSHLAERNPLTQKTMRPQRALGAHGPALLSLVRVFSFGGNLFGRIVFREFSYLRLTN